VKAAELADDCAIVRYGNVAGAQVLDDVPLMIGGRERKSHFTDVAANDVALISSMKRDGVQYQGQKQGYQEECDSLPI
jgi:hypothetical protein